MKKQTQKKATYKLKDLKLDKEEREMLKSFERGEWETVANFEEELKLAKETARNSLRKDVRINIRLSSIDLTHIKQRAAYEGLPYQSLIASVLHMYAAGHLKRCKS